MAKKKPRACKRCGAEYPYLDALSADICNDCLRRQQMLDREAVRVVCIEARSMLEHIREKVPKSPHGAGPDGWLEDAIRHLNLIVDYVVENEP